MLKKPKYNDIIDWAHTQTEWNDAITEAVHARYPDDVDGLLQMNKQARELIIKLIARSRIIRGKLISKKDEIAHLSKELAEYNLEIQ